MKLIIFLCSLISLNTCNNSKKTLNFSQNEIETKLELNGTYVIKSLQNEDVSAYGLEVNFNAEKQKITGFSGCNRFFGNYTLSEKSITFGALGSTKMFCEKEANTVETNLFEALSKIDHLNSNNATLEFISNKGIVLTMIKNPQVMPVMFEYSTTSRGVYKSISINKKQVSVVNKRDDDPVIKVCSAPEWEQLINAIKTVDVKNISNLKAPSDRRFFDGALIAKLIIYSDDKKYESASFDHGNPPKEIETIVKEILSISENIE
ncbi:META domain-containing protein [Gaetbulibacter aquiaggeris]|uniref:META domain-containing protein n=1 Tax=Gaetbulibacter aquiaggeris TaxID=1735373 RepID=A0ABW7MLA6_9FLAO